MWTHKYKKQEPHLEPGATFDPFNALVDITVEFTDGVKTYERTYLVNLGAIKEPADLVELVEADLAILNGRDVLTAALDGYKNRELPKKREGAVETRL